MPTIGTAAGAGLGALGGAKYAKDLGSILTGGDTPDKLGPPQTLPNDTPLQPTVTTPDGGQYALVQVDGKYTWFAMLDNSDLTVANQYVEVIRGAQIAELTNNYLGASGFEQQVATHNAQVAASNTQIAQDTFIQSEISYRNQSEAVTNNLGNGLAPDGSALNKQQNSPDGSSVVWTRDPASGSLIRIATSGSGNNLTAVEERYDAVTGQPLGGTIYQPDGQGGFKQTPFGNASASSISEAAVPTHTFNPLPNSGTADNSYSIKPGDSLWKIGKTLGLSDSETARFVAETQADARVAGSNGNVDDLKPGNTIAIPDWAKDKLAAYKEASINGLDLPPEITPTSSGADGSDAHFNHHPAPEDSTPIADAAYEQLAEAFGKPTEYTKENDTQLADAGNSGVVSDAGGGNSESNKTAAPVEPVQTAPETIAEQAPPEVPEKPFVQYGSEYNATLQPYAQALNLLKSLDGLQHWDQLGDVGKLTTAMSLYTQLDSLGTTYGSGEHNLWGGSGVGAALSYISLAQSIESGNILGTLSSINAIGDQALDGAINSALGSSGVPYVGILMALNNFEAHPGQAIGSLVGMCFGPIGSMVGGLIGGLLDDAFGPHPSPPQAQGEIHFEWNAQGDIHTVVDVNRHGGGTSATGVAHSVQSMLEQMVQSLNAQTLQQHPDTPASELMAINPNLLPRIGFSANNSTHKPVTWMEITQPDGSVSHESLSQDDLAQRLLTLLTDNGGLAPQWLVDTQEAHYHHLIDTGADAATLARELHAGQGGHAAVGNQAFALEGNASESADFKSQSFGALVVHEQAVAQTIAQVTTLQVLRDAENDGFLEPTEWVAAADDLGRTQGLLVIDFNGTTHADLQRNNVQRLVYCYTFDSCLRTSPMCHRPKSLASANDADWRNAA